MGRGKIQIKRIDNPTNRQVTFSKRRNGLFKKANELSVLCDAKVSIIMISSTGRLNEYRSDNITTKQIFDKYQEATGKDLWNSRYQKMQEELRLLKEKNSRLTREIRQRIGEELSHLSVNELMGLEQEMEAAFKLIHERMMKKIEAKKTREERKVRSLQENLKTLRFQLAERCGDEYWFVKNEEDEPAVAPASGALNLYAYRQHIQVFKLGHSRGFEPYKLRL